MLEVTCLVLIKANSVLVAKRDATQSNAGQWEFPGGKVQLQESYKNCIIREIREELNIEVQSPFRCKSLIKNKIKLIPFFAKKWSGEIRPCVHDEIQFINFNHLLELNLSEPDVPLAHYIMDNWDTINASL